MNCYKTGMVCCFILMHRLCLIPLLHQLLMMYQKVLMFRQYDLAEKILASNNPSEISA